MLIFTIFLSSRYKSRNKVKKTRNTYSQETIVVEFFLVILFFHTSLFIIFHFMLVIKITCALCKNSYVWVVLLHKAKKKEMFFSPRPKLKKVG